MTFEEFKREELKKPDVRAEYDALELEFFLMESPAKKKALQSASWIAEENGISDMSLYEINAEIAAARNGKALQTIPL